VRRNAYHRGVCGAAHPRSFATARIAAERFLDPHFHPNIHQEKQIRSRQTGQHIHPIDGFRQIGVVGERMSIDPVRNPTSEPLPSADGAGPGVFKWTCLALAVVFLSVLTFLINDAREQTRRVHEELRRVRDEIVRSKPTLTLEGEVDPLAHSDKVPHFIGISYHPSFASPPHLTFPDGHADWEITVQKADSFGLSRDPAGDGNKRKFKWKAEGQPAKTKVEEQIEANGQTLGAILRDLQLQGNDRRSENAALLREVQSLREMAKKRYDEGKK
jgi:hypothetical protein